MDNSENHASESSDAVCVDTPALKSLLSAREAQTIHLVAQGLKNKEIAEEMLISEQTVKNHLQHIFDKLGTVSKGLRIA